MIDNKLIQSTSKKCLLRIVRYDMEVVGKFSSASFLAQPTWFIVRDEGRTAIMCVPTVDQSCEKAAVWIRGSKEKQNVMEVGLF